MVPTTYIAALIVLLTALGWIAGALRIDLVAILLAVAFVGFSPDSKAKKPGSEETMWPIGGDGGDISHGAGDGCGGGDGGGGGD
jgi:hypothetical protein